MEEIQPCPFCGSAGRYIEEFGLYGCTKCDVWQDTLDDWNIRKYIDNETKDYISTLKAYIALLTDELKELSGHARVHGHVSSRVQAGIELRDKLSNGNSEKFGEYI